MKQILTLPALALVCACAQIEPIPRPVAPAPAAPPPPPVAAPPAPVSVTPLPPPADARTVDSFDTTTDAERAAAVAAAEAAPQSGSIGTTVASLGDPARPGLWIETPLATQPAKGRVIMLANGNAVELDLIPIEGPKTAGSRLSLAAMRALEASLTDLPELEVYAN